MAAGSCPQCGSPRVPGSRFCGTCAFDFWKAAESSTPPPTQTPQTQAATPGPVVPAPAPGRGWSRKRIALVGAGVLIALAVIGSLTNDDPGVARQSEAAATPTERPTPRPQESTPAPVPPLPAEPAFADIVLSGSGDSVPTFTIPEDIAAIAVITHNGDGNFAVFTVAADGTNNDLLVNTIGSYSGTVLFDQGTGVHSVAFEVTAGGAWTITIRPVTAARAWDGSAPLNGSGDDVVVVSPQIQGLASAVVQHTGSSNFAIFAYSSSGADLLVNEIGAYTGEVLLGGGTFLLEITADGAWTVAPS